MAGKKDKKKDENNEVAQEESAGSKLLTILIVFVIVAIWLALFCVLIKFDVGHFGSEVLYPILKDVPVVNKVLPPVEGGQEPEGYTDIDAANARIQELEKQLADAQNSGTASEEEVKDLRTENERLKKYEEQQRAFEKRVKEFDEQVVYNDKAPELSEYQKYYEEIDPDNAAELYKQVVQDVQQSMKITKQSTLYSKMEPAQAASVLETMSGDLDLVAAILDGMSESKSAAILANMSPETAAQITTKMTAK